MVFLTSRCCCGPCEDFPDEIWLEVEGDIVATDYEAAEGEEVVQADGLLESMLGTFHLTRTGPGSLCWSTGVTEIECAAGECEEYSSLCDPDALEDFGGFHEYYPDTHYEGSTCYPASSYVCYCQFPQEEAREVEVSEVQQGTIDDIACPYAFPHFYSGDCTDWFLISGITCLAEAIQPFGGIDDDYDSCALTRVTNLPTSGTTLVHCTGLVSVTLCCEGGTITATLNVEFERYYKGGVICELVTLADAGDIAGYLDVAGSPCEVIDRGDIDTLYGAGCAAQIDSTSLPRCGPEYRSDDSSGASFAHIPTRGTTSPVAITLTAQLILTGPDSGTTLTPSTDLLTVGNTNDWECGTPDSVNPVNARCENYTVSMGEITAYDLAVVGRPSYEYEEWIGPNPAINGGPNDEVGDPANFDTTVEPQIMLCCKLENYSATIHLTDPDA